MPIPKSFVWVFSVLSIVIFLTVIALKKPEPKKTYTVLTYFDTYTGLTMTAYNGPNMAFKRHDGSTVQVFGNFNVEEEKH
jgi:hypothetical protein